MTEATLARTYISIVMLGRRATRGPFWMWRATLIVVIAALFVSFPSYDTLFTDNAADTWEPVLRQFSSPFTNMSDFYGAGSHASKKTFRLTVPLIGHLFGLNVLGAVLLQFATGVLLLHIVLQVTFKLTKDRLAGFFITLSVGFSYPGVTSFVELRGIFDGVALLLLTAAILFDNPFLIGSLVFLASWTDERGLIASALVLLFHSVEGVAKRADTPSSLHVKFLNYKSLAVIMAWFLYFSTRFYLAHKMDLTTATEGVGVSIFLDQINIIPLGLWTGLEGGWLFIALAAIALLVCREYKLLAALTLSMGLIGVVSVSVVDVTRSMAYLLPALFIAARVLANVDTHEQIRRYSVVACFISLFWATYYAGGISSIWWHYPLPIQVVRWITGGY